ncbi:hypothetical protein A1O3_03481 [Capronia epimyces CBS 606.96]|uniref:Uncharacterized protein n=1 Tax=Capronia epimyces CBS 606.96 TaxID=1182542 RepID=W9YA57_9EURO|nr:uncharacterized protein A1O3_03481 [Capronia epimyces CBS 606.96]EXJ86530.1 hypothetical protein A1O3_03481 [Capronia epimyces CBS 606.96]
MTTPSGRLQGRVAIVTGSSSGLGQAICLAFAAEGASVFCIDLHPTAAPRHNTSTAAGAAGRTAESSSWSTGVPLPSLHYSSRGSSATATATGTAAATPPPGSGPNPGQQAGTHERIRQTGGEATWHRADVTRARDMELAVRACVQQYGRVDIMVNNAGVSVESTHPRPLRCHETGEDDWDRTLAVNAKGMFLGCKYALKQMLGDSNANPNPNPNPNRGDVSGSGGGGAGGTSGQPQRYASRGWIVNVASVQGLVPYYGTPSYCASKGAAVMLTKQIALDYAPDRIHCNALCPGFLDTRMTQNLQSQDRLLADIQSKHPFGGTLGCVDDVAKAAVFLASDDAAWITGVPVPVDGGYLLR